MITIIHPSKGRPGKSFLTMCKWLERAGFSIELVAVIDNDDLFKDEYYKLYQDLTKQFKKHEIRLIVATSTNAIQAINLGAKLAKGDIFVVASDDTDCPWNWAGKIETIARGIKDFVIAVDDGHQDNSKVITMPILDRVYYNRFGYIYHPDYIHMWGDKEFATVAYRLRKVIKSELKFLHQQYSIVGDKPDQVNLKNNASHEHGKKLYFKRLKQGFPK